MEPNVTNQINPTGSSYTCRARRRRRRGGSSPMQARCQGLQDPKARRQRNKERQEAEKKKERERVETDREKGGGTGTGTGKKAGRWEGKDGGGEGEQQHQQTTTIGRRIRSQAPISGTDKNGATLKSVVGRSTLRKSLGDRHVRCWGRTRCC